MRRNDLRHGEKLIAAALATLIRGIYQATHYPTQDEIAAVASLSDRSVRRHIKGLEKAGVIRRRPLGIGQAWATTIYRLVIQKKKGGL